MKFRIKISFQKCIVKVIFNISLKIKKKIFNIINDFIFFNKYS